MECGPQVGVERSVQASQADAGRCNKDACDQRVLPRWRGEAWSKPRLEGTARGEGEVGWGGSFQEEQEAEKEWRRDLDLGQKGS